MELSALLKELYQGAKHWNAWRKNFSPLQINLDGIQLEQMDLSGYDLSKLSLRNAKITRCKFHRADLISANFEGSLLRENDFFQAKMIASRLVNCDLTGSKLQGANLLTAIMQDTRLEKIDFRGMDLSGLSLKKISLAGSNLEGQQLARIDFTGSNLAGASFRNADLTAAIFVNTDLRATQWENAKLEGAVFKNANLQGANLSWLELRAVDFTQANLLDVDLRGSNLIRTKLGEADITGAKLWKIATQGWSIANIRCEYAYWDESGQDKTGYRSHEFERIFAEAINIELRYPYRLSDHELATLPIFIEHLAAVHWGTIIRLKSITDVAGGALVKFIVEEVGPHNPAELKDQLQQEAERIQLAQLTLRNNSQLHLQLKEKIAAIREQFWPRLLELAVDHEQDQLRNLTILFMDLKDFSRWDQEQISERLALFRGLVKPVLRQWGADHPNMEGDSLRITFKNATTGLSCACMLRDVLRAAGFQLRIGMELGEVAVIHNEVTNIPDLEGSAVNMAARIEAAAAPGELLVSPRVRHYAERSNLFSFQPRRVPLKKAIGSLEAGDQVECFAVERLS